MSDDEKYVYGAHPIEIIIAIRESSYHLPDERDPGSVRDCCDMLTDEIGRLEQRIKQLEAENKKKDTAIEKKVDELIEAYKWNYEVKEDLKQLRRMYE